MRHLAFVVALLLSIPGLALAQPYQTPQAMISAFYAPYLAGEIPGNEADFRSSALEALYDEDALATPAGEQGALSFDPYIDGQDWELSEFTIDAVDIEGNRAEADVSFRNFGQPVSLSYELVYEGGWKIDDVVSTDPSNPYRLTDIFAVAGEFSPVDD